MNPFFTLLFIIGSLILNSVQAFAPLSSFNRPTQLNGYIQSDSVDEAYKGVDLAQAIENAILISGHVDKNGNAIAKDMKNYKKVIKTDFGSSGGKLICKGEGQEIYKDPGLSTEKIISLAPYTAVENALAAIESNNKDGNIFVNFAGGDDLMVHEVLGSVERIVASMDLSSKVQFRSLCEPSFPMEKCGLIVVSFDGDSEGHIYYNDGAWYSLSEDDSFSILE